ncbi:MAG: HD domain-containing protein [Lentimicrobium sp.]|nr:HD domain-containing protein [Lentimicrobium sp.]
MNFSFDQYNIDFSRFSLNESQFDHHSKLHGILHTYRVMLHCLRLGIITGNIHDAKTAFFAAYIHDMARMHDGYCTEHGANSANLKLPLHRTLFIENGATEAEIMIIGKAVALHSTSVELPENDPDHTIVSILKDADALDRIRLGANDLNPSYLRLKESHAFIKSGVLLYEQTHGRNYKDFRDFLKNTDINNL